MNTGTDWLLFKWIMVSFSLRFVACCNVAKMVTIANKACNHYNRT